MNVKSIQRRQMPHEYKYIYLRLITNDFVFLKNRWSFESKPLDSSTKDFKRQKDKSICMLIRSIWDPG